MLELNEVDWKVHHSTLDFGFIHWVSILPEVTVNDRVFVLN